MSEHGANRVYNIRSLEAWFEHVQYSWEESFSADELSNARKLYRDGKVSELEVKGDTAVVYLRQKKDEFYSVIDWDGTQMDVRHSVKDAFFGRSLAAAGLYEIEELIADEMSDLPPEFESPQKTETEGDEKGRAESQPDRAIEGVVKKKDPKVLGRVLVLKFHPGHQGLCLDAYWEDHGQLRRVFKKDEAQAEHSSLTPPEREKVISLTTRAHRAGFLFNPRKGQFILSTLLRIKPFLDDILPPWRKYYKVILDERLNAFRRGVQRINMKIRINASAGERMSVHCDARVGKNLLSLDVLRNLFHKRDDVYVSKDLGLLELSADQWKLLNRWEAFILSDDQALPRYLLFSFLYQSEIPITLDSVLETWAENIKHLPRIRKMLPTFYRNYQKAGVLWLKHLTDHDCHPLLADEMGLGKTLQILGLIYLEQKQGSKMPNLVVCPASVIPVWENECLRFFPSIKTRVLDGKTRFSDRKGEPLLWLASYTQLRRHKAQLEDIDFNLGILDEGQFIKNPDTKVFHATCSIRSKKRIVVTGTPVENRLQDLWTIFRFLMPGFLGNRKQFDDVFVRGEGKRVVSIRDQVEPFILRRKKSEVLSELPPKVEIPLLCKMTPVQESEYNKLIEQGRREFGEDLEEIEGKQQLSFFALLTRLRQASCDPQLLPDVESPLDNSGKIITLLDKLEQIFINGQKVVIFSQFVQFLNRIEEAIKTHFKSPKIWRLTGATKNRQKPVAEFQALSGESGVFLASLKAGGTGITLNTADFVFLMDPWWNPAVENQAIDRIHRLGQKNRVFVYRLISQSTIEENVEILKENKRDLFEDTINSLNDLSDLKTHFSKFSALVETEPLS